MDAARPSLDVPPPVSAAEAKLRVDAADYLEGLLEGFVAYDADWRAVYMNAAGERLLRRARGEVLGKTWHQAFPHAVGNPVDQMYQRVMRTRTPERLEYFYSHYDMWMEIAASPSTSGGLGVYFRDVSDRIRAAEDLREADRRKDQFLATLAHELRNPLAPIRNALQLLNVVPADSEPAGQAREIMARQLTHLVRLVDDLLEVSRITRGKIELRCSRIDLAQVLLSALETSRPVIEAARHRLEVSLPAEPIYVEADFVRIAQVVSNLLNNAAKYTEESGTVSLSLAREEQAAVVRVRDSGVGIPPEMLPRVFDMFAQVNTTLQRAQGGLGIGLGLARTLVEMHGGRIEARSEGAGRGSEFCVRLPLERA